MTMIGKCLKLRGLSAPTSKVLPFLLLFLFPPGCQGPWEAYQEIELGKPIPKESFLAEKGVRKGNTTTWMEPINIPLFFSGFSWTVTHEQNDIVIRKTYFAFATADWLFFSSGAYRFVHEFTIPPNARFYPPANWNSYKTNCTNIKWEQLHHVGELYSYLEKDFFFPSNFTVDDNIDYEWTFLALYKFFVLHATCARGYYYLENIELWTFLPGVLNGIFNEGYTLEYHNAFGEQVTIRTKENGVVRMEIKSTGTAPSILYVLLLCLFNESDPDQTVEQDRYLFTWKIRRGKGMPLETYTMTWKELEQRQDQMRKAAMPETAPAE
jgi:hypothetical protein